MTARLLGRGVDAPTRRFAEPALSGTSADRRQTVHAVHRAAGTRAAGGSSHPPASRFSRSASACSTRERPKMITTQPSRAMLPCDTTTRPKPGRAASLGRLKSWGFTTIGGWSDYKSLVDNQPKHDLWMTPVVTLGARSGAPWFDMWDEKVIRRIDEVAEETIVPLRGDPRVIGYYSDNELGWWNAILWKMTLEQPATSGQRQRLIRMVREDVRRRLERARQGFRTTKCHKLAGARPRRHAVAAARRQRHPHHAPLPWPRRRPLLPGDARHDPQVRPRCAVSRRSLPVVLLSRGAVSEPAVRSTLFRPISTRAGTTARF